ncbi:MAG TPA: arylesterase [Gemmatimonadaceae bacterium]
MSMKKDVGYVGYCAGAGIAALLLLSACGPAAKDKTPVTPATVPAVSHDPTPAMETASRGPTVLFIGTSLTAGLGLPSDQAFPVLVQQKADSAGTPIVAVNAGVSGETSAGALNRIDWVMRAPADIVVIETGANDALRALPVAEARSNISKILDRVRAAKPNARILLVQMEAPPNLGPQYTTAFHQMYVDLAREKGVTLGPFLLGGVAGIAALNQADGVHPNAKGERIVASNVWKALEPVVKG